MQQFGSDGSNSGRGRCALEKALLTDSVEKVGSCAGGCSLIQSLREAGLKIMMGRQVEQAALFYEFSLETHVPADHRLRSIDRFVELGQVRRELAAFYSTLGRPSIDPELIIRMLIVGYCFGIRSERRLCEEVHLNLAYRWFCRLGLTAMSRIIPPSRRTGMAVSARAICCGASLRRSCNAGLAR